MQLQTLLPRSPKLGLGNTIFLHLRRYPKSQEDKDSKSNLLTFATLAIASISNSYINFLVFLLSLDLLHTLFYYSSFNSLDYRNFFFCTIPSFSFIRIIADLIQLW